MTSGYRWKAWLEVVQDWKPDWDGGGPNPTKVPTFWTRSCSCWIASWRVAAIRWAEASKL